MFRHTALAASLIVALTGVLTASPAAADRAVVPDGSGDVWKQSGEDGYTLVGTAPNTDLTETRVTHRGRYVVIRAVYDALEKGAPEEFEYRGILRAPRPNGLRRFVVYVRADGPNGRTKYSLAHYWEGVLVDCAGLTGRTRFGADVLNVRVPRRCLGNPRWVQFQGAAYSYTEEGLFNDDAQRPGPYSTSLRPKSWTRRLHLD